MRSWKTFVRQLDLDMSRYLEVGCANDLMINIICSQGASFSKTKTSKKFRVPELISKSEVKLWAKFYHVPSVTTLNSPPILSFKSSLLRYGIYSKTLRHARYVHCSLDKCRWNAKSDNDPHIFTIKHWSQKKYYLESNN